MELPAEQQKPNLSRFPGEILERINNLIATEGDISSFSKTCRHIKNHGTRSLFRRNIDEGRSSVIPIVVSITPNEAGAIEMAKGIIKRALNYGANVEALHHFKSDVLATGLHLAAAGQHYEIVELLIDRKARLESLALGMSNLLYDPSAARELCFEAMDRNAQAWNSRPLWDIVRHGYWLPIFMPLLHDDWRMVRLLFKYHAPAQVVLPSNRATLTRSFKDGYHIQLQRDLEPLEDVSEQQEMLTVLHVMAGKSSPTMNQKCRWVMKTLRHRIHDIVPGTGGNALRLAVLSQNHLMIDALLERGLDMDVQDATGMPLLSEIISLICHTDDAGKRGIYKSLAEKIIGLGADTNSPMSTTATPLVVLLDQVKFGWSDVSRYLKPILGLLLDHGANLNDTVVEDIRPATPFSMLVSNAASRSRTEALELLIKELLNRGADLNAPNLHRSVLMCALQPVFLNEESDAGVVRKLLILGARFYPTEIEEAFCIGLELPSLSRRMGLMDFLRPDVTQSMQDRAYYNAVFCNDDATIRLRKVKLLDEFKFSHSQPACLAFEAIQRNDYHVYKFFKDTIVNANWSDPITGRNLFHTIVRLLHNHRAYTEKNGLADAAYFAKRGARIRKRDHDGRTPIHLLSPSKDAYPRLLIMFYEMDAYERNDV
jgi:ankyrin repeat protein